jgi:hypothetical protein
MKFSGKFWIERIILICAIASMVHEIERPGGDMSAIASVIFAVAVFVGLPYLLLRKETPVIESS